MNEERKIVKSTLTTASSPYGFGSISATFEAERFDGGPLLDTYTQLDITPFSITWNDREKFLEELSAVIGKFQI